MDLQQQPDPGTSLFQLNLDATNSYTLRSAASWAKVTGICSIIIGAILILSAISALTQLQDLGYRGRSEGLNGMMYGGGDVGLGVTMILIAAVLFIVAGIFSFVFGNKIGGALRANDQNSLNAGFAALRNFYALRGIVMIIFLLLMLIGFAASL